MSESKMGVRDLMEVAVDWSHRFSGALLFVFILCGLLLYLNLLLDEHTAISVALGVVGGHAFLAGVALLVLRDALERKLNRM